MGDVLRVKRSWDGVLLTSVNRGIGNGCGRIWDHGGGLRTPFVILYGELLFHTLHPLHSHSLKYIVVLLEHCVMFS